MTPGKGAASVSAGGGDGGGDTARVAVRRAFAAAKILLLAYDASMNLFVMSLPAARAVECTELSVSPSSQESLWRLPWRVGTCVSACPAEQKIFSSRLAGEEPDAREHPAGGRRGPHHLRAWPAELRVPLGLKGWALGRLRLKRLKTGLGRF